MEEEDDISLNPLDWFVTDLSTEKSFGSAFKKAKQTGLNKFKFQGKKYSTEVKPRVDLSNESNFNSAFKKAKNSNEPEFTYKGKVFKTVNIPDEENDNLVRSKSFVQDYLNNNSFSSDRINKPGYFSVTNQPKFKNTGGWYNSDTNELYIDSGTKSTPSHEYAHKAGLRVDNKDTEKLKQSYLNRVNKGEEFRELLGNIDYVLDPRERGARHMATKYFLKENGFNGDKIGPKEYKFLSSEIKKGKERFDSLLYSGDMDNAYKELRSVPADIQQLFELYGDEDSFIRQLNKPLKQDTTGGTSKSTETDPSPKKPKSEEFDFSDITPDGTDNEFDFSDIKSDEEWNTGVSREPENPYEQVGKSLEKGAIITPIHNAMKGLYDLGRTAYSTLVDTTPAQTAQGIEVLRSQLQPTNVKEFIDKDHSIDFQKYVRSKDPAFRGISGFLTPFNSDDYMAKYGNQFMVDKGFGGKVEEMKKRLPEVIKRRGKVEEYVQQQNKEAAYKTAGVTKDLSEVKDLSSALSLAGGFAGQAVGQIPLSVLTKGTSSLVMESASVYDKQLDELAKKHGISRQEVIKRNLDEPTLNQQYAVLAAAMDAGSAGSILGALRKGAGTSSAKKIVANVLGEGLTEGAQGNIERAAGTNAAGVDFDPFTKENALATANEVIAGSLGGGIFSVNGMSTKQGKQAIVDKYIDEHSTGDPAIDDAIKNSAALSPEEETAVRQSIAQEAAVEAAKEVKTPELKLNEDAVQESSTEGIPVREQSESSEGVSESNTKGETATEETGQEEVENPAYKEAVARIESLKQKFASSDINEDTDALYQELQAAKQAVRQIAPTIISNKKSEIKTRIEDTTGVTKPERSIKMTPNEAIKHQVQTFYKGVKEGVVRGAEAKNDLVNKVQDAIKESPLSPKQVSTILTKLRNTNLFTAGSISKLNSFIDRVSSDAEYANKLDEAKQLNKQIRKLAKNKENLQNVRTLGKSFASINPEETFINQHLETGRKIFNALSSPSKENYEAVNVPESEEYVNDLKEKIGTEEEASLPKEETEKSNRVKQGLAFAVESLKEKDLSEFDDSDKARIESIKNIDINGLDESQSKASLRVIDNIVHNDDLSGITKVESIAKAQQTLKALKEKLNGRKISEVKWGGQLFNNNAQLFRQIFRDSRTAADVNSAIGAQEMYAAGSRTENMEDQRSHEYNELAREFNKKTGDDIRSLDNQAKMYVFSLLYRHVKGEDPTAHIAKIKNNVEQSIKTRRDAGQDREADAWQKAYDQFKDVSSPDEALAVMQKDAPLLKVWEFFPKMFADDINEGFKAVTEEVHNKPYVEEQNYTTTKLENVSSNIKSKEQFSEGEQGQSNKIAPSQAKTSIKATRNVPPGFAYATDFVNAQFDAYRKSMYDIQASRAEALLKEIIYSKEFADIIGGPENAKVIQDQLKAGRDIQAGVTRKATNLMTRLGTGFTQYIRSIGAAKALGSTVGSVLKQSFPVLTKAAFNHLGSGTLTSLYKGLGTKITPNVRKLLNQSQVGVRRKRLGGTERGESVSHKLGIRRANRFSRVLEWARVNQDWLAHKSMWALTTTDSTIAEKTWISYYLQRLKELGVENVNMDDEINHQNDPKRKQAVAYAEQLISETQLPSNPAELSAISRNDKNEAFNLMKNIFLPFANYSLNAKRRFMLNATAAFRNPSKENIANVAGDAAEILAFAAIQVYLLGLYRDAIKKMYEEALGLEPPEEDKEKKDKNKSKAFWSSVLGSIAPTSVGTIGEDKTAWAINAIAWIAEHPDSSMSEWKKETGGFVFEGNKDQGNDYGLLSLGAAPTYETVMGVAQILDTRLLDDTIEVNGPFETTKEIKLNKDQLRALQAKTLVETMSALGLNEADLFNQIRKSYRDQLKNEGDSESAPKKRRRHRTVHHRRHR